MVTHSTTLKRLMPLVFARQACYAHSGRDQSLHPKIGFPKGKPFGGIARAEPFIKTLTGYEGF